VLFQKGENLWSREIIDFDAHVRSFAARAMLANWLLTISSQLLQESSDSVRSLIRMGEEHVV
jgi:hypothetical protein